MKILSQRPNNVLEWWQATAGGREHFVKEEEQLPVKDSQIRDATKGVQIWFTPDLDTQIFTLSLHFRQSRNQDNSFLTGRETLWLYACRERGKKQHRKKARLHLQFVGLGQDTHKRSRWFEISLAQDKNWFSALSSNCWQNWGTDDFLKLWNSSENSLTFKFIHFLQKVCDGNMHKLDVTLVSDKQAQPGC